MWGCTTSPRFNPLTVPIYTSRLCPRQNYHVWMSVPNFSAHARTHTRTHTHTRAHTHARTHTHTHHARVRATKSCCHPHPLILQRLNESTGQKLSWVKKWAWHQETRPATTPDNSKAMTDDESGRPDDTCCCLIKGKLMTHFAPAVCLSGRPVTGYELTQTPWYHKVMEKHYKGEM